METLGNLHFWIYCLITVSYFSGFFENYRMATVNDNYLKLKAGYLFPEIARRVNAFVDANPDAKISQ